MRVIPRVSTCVRDRMKLVMAKAILVVTVPSELEGSFHRIRSLSLHSTVVDCPSPRAQTRREGWQCI